MPSFDVDESLFDAVVIGVHRDFRCGPGLAFAGLHVVAIDCGRRVVAAEVVERLGPVRIAAEAARAPDTGQSDIAHRCAVHVEYAHQAFGVLQIGRHQPSADERHAAKRLFRLGNHRAGHSGIVRRVDGNQFHQRRAVIGDEIEHAAGIADIAVIILETGNDGARIAGFAVDQRDFVTVVRAAGGSDDNAAAIVADRREMVQVGLVGCFVDQRIFGLVEAQLMKYTL